MPRQFSFGLAVELGKDTLVLALNSPVTIPVKEKYAVKVGKGIDVKALAGNKLKFPAKGAHAALVIVDDEFEQVRVIKPTAAALTASGMAVKSKFNGEEFNRRATQLIDAIDENGELAKLVLTLVEIDAGPLQHWLTSIAKRFEGLDWDAIGIEVAALAKVWENKLPSATEE